MAGSQHDMKIFILHVHRPRTPNGFEKRFKIVILPGGLHVSVIRVKIKNFITTQIQKFLMKFVVERDLHSARQNSCHCF